VAVAGRGGGGCDSLEKTTQVARPELGQRPGGPVWKETYQRNWACCGSKIKEGKERAAKRIWAKVKLGIAESFSNFDIRFRIQIKRGFKYLQAIFELDFKME
jgi:hypothetical protein